MKNFQNVMPGMVSAFLLCQKTFLKKNYTISCNAKYIRLRSLLQYYSFGMAIRSIGRQHDVSVVTLQLYNSGLGGLISSILIHTKTVCRLNHQKCQNMTPQSGIFENLLCSSTQQAFCSYLFLQHICISSNVTINLLFCFKLGICQKTIGIEWRNVSYFQFFYCVVCASCRAAFNTYLCNIKMCIKMK